MEIYLSYWSHRPSISTSFDFAIPHIHLRLAQLFLFHLQRQNSRFVFLRKYELVRSIFHLHLLLLLLNLTSILMLLDISYLIITIITIILLSRHIFGAHPAMIADVRWQVHQDYLLVGCEDGTVSIWEVPILSIPFFLSIYNQPMPFPLFFLFVNKHLISHIDEYRSIGKKGCG